VMLSANGANRQFNYAIPKPGLPVASGTLLFAGRKSGDNYSGTAYVFSERCGASGYSVSGPVAPDQRSVTMYGKAPRTDASCRVVGYRDDVLVFNFIDANQARDANQGSTQEESRVAGQDLGSTMICAVPVYGEEYRLRQTIDGNEATTDYVAAAINYLHARYCREIAETPEQDDSRQIAETCFERTGIFRGERVYWGQCFE
jgi:hypothetical protein